MKSAVYLQVLSGVGNNVVSIHVHYVGMYMFVAIVPVNYSRIDSVSDGGNVYWQWYATSGSVSSEIVGGCGPNWVLL